MRRVSSIASGRSRIVTGAIALLALAPAVIAQGAKKAPKPVPNAPAASAATGTLDRIKKTQTLNVGYRTDARPFSYKDESGKPTGYTVELCQSVVESVKTDLNLPALKVTWVPVTADNRFDAIQQGQVDVLCGSATATLERRKQVAFSIPIFPGGVGAIIRSDSPKQLRNILSGQAQSYQPTWRAVALNVLREQNFAAVGGTTAEHWLNQKGKELQVEWRLTPVATYDAGVDAVASSKAGAFFGERAALLNAVQRHPSASRLTVVDRQFTFEPLALAMARGDDDFRLLVDRSLSQFFASPGFGAMYARWFGKPDETAKNFFRWNALSE